MSQFINIFYNYYSKEKVYFLIKDGEKSKIEESEVQEYPQAKKRIFLISDLFNAFQINLPETTASNQKKALPFLIQDQLLEDVNNYSKFLNYDENILIFSKKDNLKDLMKDIDLFSTYSLQPIEASFEEDKIIVFEDRVILALNNKWYWSGALETFESFLPILKKQFSNQIIKCEVIEKIPQSLKGIDFLKTKVHQDIESLWIENMPIEKKDFNILRGRFEPKIDWLKKIKEWRLFIYAGIAVYSIFLISSLIQITAMSISNQNYKNQLTNVFNEKFPNEILRTDLISQVNNLVNINSYTKQKLDSLSLLSTEISIIEDMSLISINSDSNNLSIEVEAVSYEQLENLVKLMATLGVEMSIGSSRRFNNLLLGELNIGTY